MKTLILTPAQLRTIKDALCHTVLTNNAGLGNEVLEVYLQIFTPRLRKRKAKR